jgi:uncharacterized membrane protein
MQLFEHHPHPHIPRNINQVVRAGKTTNRYTRFNENAAIWTTWLFSTMEMFWAMDLFIAVWMLGNSIGIWHFDPMPYPFLLFIINIPQLPLLPLLAIKQNVIDKKQSLSADEQFSTTQKTYHDIEQIVKHLEAQDQELLKQSSVLRELQRRLS